MMHQDEPQRCDGVGVVTGALELVADPHRAELLELGRDGEQQGWLQPYHSELPDIYTTYIGFEAEARSVSNYESLLVPGLLQTEDYARAVITGGLPMASEHEVEQRVQARMERQRLLSKPDPLKLWAIVDEAALYRQVGGPDVMRAQLVHLVKAVGEPHVTFQIIPFSAGAYAGMPGSFVLLDFPNPADPDVVYIDTRAGDLFLEKEADLRRFHLLFEHLRAVASSVEVATLDGATAVRDSKDPAGPALTVTPAAWAAFTVSVRAGEFD